MKEREIIFALILALLFLTAAAWAEAPWEVLVRSDGGIVAASLSPAGDLMVQEQLRFTKVNPIGQANAQDLPMSQRIFLSPSSGAYASISYEGPQDLPSAAALTVYRANGGELWTLSHHLLNDVYPFNSGAAVAVARNNSVLENQVYFFSAKGKTVKELTLSAVGEIRISPSDDRVLINSGVEGLLLFDTQGNQLADLGPAYRWNFSRDGRWVAVLYGPRMSLFHDGQATYVGEPSGEIVRGASFSPDNAHLAAFSDHAVVVLENPSGKVLMQEHLDMEGQFSFTSIDLTRDAACVVTGVERDLGESVQGPERHPDGQVRLYNLKGSICFQENVSYRHWNTTTPRVSFSPDGQSLMLLTRDEIRRAPLGSLCREGGEQ